MGVIAVVAFYTVADVFLRYAFNAPLPGAVDIVSYGLAVAVACVLPYSIVTHQHVSVTLFIDHLPGVVRRVLDALILAVNAGFFCLLAWRSIVFAEEKFAGGEKMWILGWPVWPAWGLIAAGLAVAAAVSVLIAAFAVNGIARPAPREVQT